MSVQFWVLWAFILFLQNLSFTFVSRARNSGSLSRHMYAAFLSNGVWFVSQAFAVDAFLRILSGKFGWKMAVFAALFYTAFTVVGSVVAHYMALRSEKDSGAVGANKKYAQVPIAEWAAVRRFMVEYGWQRRAELQRVKEPTAQPITSPRGTNAPYLGTSLGDSINA